MSAAPREMLPTDNKAAAKQSVSSLTTYGSTVFKFNRSEKKWKEKGSGDVTFSLKQDQLLVSVGKLSFVVQGGVRPKGAKAIVMRGKEVRDPQVGSGEAIILAVRFERERDSRNLFTMLSTTPWIRPQRGRKVSKKRTGRKSARRRPPPAWFMALGTREQENVRALVSNAQVSYLEDGTIQRQLATVYKLTPQQIDEAVDYFQPWLRNPGGSSSARHYRVSSFSIGTRTDVSSLPSIHTAKIGDGAKRLQKPVPPLRVRSPKAQQSPYPEYLNTAPAPPLEYPAPAPAKPEEAKGNEPAPLRPPSPKQRAEPNGQLPTPKKGQSSPEHDRSFPQPSYNEPRPGKPSSRLPIIDERTAPLTASNLMLHNKMLIPIKGDFRTSVSTWLRKTHGGED